MMVIMLQLLQKHYIAEFEMWKVQSTYSLGWWAWVSWSRYHRELHCQGPYTHPHSQPVGEQKGWHYKAPQQCLKPLETETQRRWASFGLGILLWSLIWAEFPFQTQFHLLVSDILEILHQRVKKAKISLTSQWLNWNTTMSLASQKPNPI